MVVAPGTIFAVAAGPESDVAPVRGLRRLAQTTSGGGVEYLQRAKLTASDGAVHDRFGESVSIDGDTMVIGAWADDGWATNSGSAYVFTRVTAGDFSSGWTQVAKLTADDDNANDYFGYSVSIDGDSMVIGARDDDDKGSNSGSAYVFTRDTAGDLSSGWTQVAKLTANRYRRSPTSATACRSTATRWSSGRMETTTGDPRSGSAYVFTRATAGDLASGWTQVAKLTASDGAADDRFGWSGLDRPSGGQEAYYDDDKATDSGSAYMFTRVTAGDLASGWTQVAKLTADDGALSVCKSLSDMKRGLTTRDLRGSAYMFTRDTAGDLVGWTQVAKVNRRICG